MPEYPNDVIKILRNSIFVKYHRIRDEEVRCNVESDYLNLSGNSSVNPTSVRSICLIPRSCAGDPSRRV